MALKNWITLFVIFSLAVTSWVYISNEMFDFYGTDAGEEYEPIYSGIQSIGIDNQSSITSNIQQNTESTTINPDFFDTITLITDVVVTAIKLPFTTMRGILTTINLIAAEVGLPAWLIKGVVTIIIAILTITILGWIFGRRTR